MMHLEKLKEPFPYDAIEWRIGRCGKNSKGIWATVLAYISARAIQDRLDSVVGPMNWQAKYHFVSGSESPTPGIICSIGIRDEATGEWTFKEDGAEQTEIESFKGGLSSALKRAGSAWGIGRYLYDLDAGFARVFETNEKGCRWGKTKEGTEFYWVPPTLPEWALPKIRLEQPGAEDGIQETGVMIPYGPLARQFVHNAEPDKLRSFIIDIELKAKQLNKPIPKWAEPIIAAFENRS